MSFAVTNTRQNAKHSFKTLKYVVATIKVWKQNVSPLSNIGVLYIVKTLIAAYIFLPVSGAYHALWEKTKMANLWLANADYLDQADFVIKASRTAV